MRISGRSSGTKTSKTERQSQTGSTGSVKKKSEKQSDEKPAKEAQPSRKGDATKTVPVQTENPDVEVQSSAVSQSPESTQPEPSSATTTSSKTDSRQSSVSQEHASPDVPELNEERASTSTSSSEPSRPSPIANQSASSSTQPKETPPSAPTFSAPSSGPQRQAVPQSNRGPAHNIIRTLSEMSDSSESDCFVQLIEKERLRTKDGKPYLKLTFRDRQRSAQVLLWSENVFYRECEKNWKLGSFFKIRGTMRDSGYGPKLELRRIREVVPQDKENGFNPRNCQPGSKTSPEDIASELLALADAYVEKGPLLNLIRRIFKEYRLRLYETAASRAHHHAYAGGLLEHTLSVTKLAVSIYSHFSAENPQLESRVSKSLLVAGAILHDVGKLLDSQTSLAGAQRTIAGNLVGHAILGLEPIQRFAAEVRLDDATKTRLEHLILTHSRFPDWGAPMPPATLEAMILHYADYVDSTFSSSLKILEEDTTPADFTQKKGPFGVPLLKQTYAKKPSQPAAADSCPPSCVPHSSPDRSIQPAPQPLPQSNPRDGSPDRYDR